MKIITKDKLYLKDSQLKNNLEKKGYQLLYVENDKDIPAVLSDDDLGIFLTNQAFANDNIAPQIRTFDPKYLPSDSFNSANILLQIAEDFRNEKKLEKELEIYKNATLNIEALDLKFRSPKEAETLAEFLSFLCPDRNDALLPLTELLMNAVEHGNLGFNAQDKQKLLTLNRWYEEVQKALVNPANLNKFVHVHFAKSPTSTEITIEDQGEGFDFAKISNQELVSTSRNGKGIKLAQTMSNAKILFLGKGNIVKIVYEY